MDRAALEIHCDDTVVREIAALARTYDLTESEVACQLLEIGLEEVDRLERPP